MTQQKDQHCTVRELQPGQYGHRVRAGETDGATSQSPMCHVGPVTLSYRSLQQVNDIVRYVFWKDNLESKWRIDWMSTTLALGRHTGDYCNI